VMQPREKSSVEHCVDGRSSNEVGPDHRIISCPRDSRSMILVTSVTVGTEEEIKLSFTVRTKLSTLLVIHKIG